MRKATVHNAVVTILAEQHPEFIELLERHAERTFLPEDVLLQNVNGRILVRIDIPLHPEQSMVLAELLRRELRHELDQDDLAVVVAELDDLDEDLLNIERGPAGFAVYYTEDSELTYPTDEGKTMTHDHIPRGYFALLVDGVAHHYGAEADDVRALLDRAEADAQATLIPTEFMPEGYTQCAFHTVTIKVAEGTLSGSWTLSADGPYVHDHGDGTTTAGRALLLPSTRGGPTLSLPFRVTPAGTLYWSGVGFAEREHDIVIEDESDAPDAVARGEVMAEHLG